MKKKVIFITGSGSGLGRQLAIQSAKLGHIVYAGTRNVYKLNGALQKAGFHFNNLYIIKLEVNKDDSVEKAVKKILVHEGRIDVLINNAGYGIVGALENISVKMMQELMNINLFGSIRCIQKVLPNMRMKGGSSIVNISSVSGVVASPFLGAYCSSKFALEGLTESLSLELAKYNIRVILIEPGLIKSEFFKNSTVVNSAKNNAYFKDVSAYVKFIKNLIETEKAQDPIETANAILSIIFSNKPGLRKQTNQWSKKIVSTKLKNEIINK